MHACTWSATSDTASSKAKHQQPPECKPRCCGRVQYRAGLQGTAAPVVQSYTSACCTDRHQTYDVHTGVVHTTTHTLLCDICHIRALNMCRHQLDLSRCARGAATIAAAGAGGCGVLLAGLILATGDVQGGVASEESKGLENETCINKTWETVSRGCISSDAGRPCHGLTVKYSVCSTCTVVNHVNTTHALVTWNR